MAVCRSHSSTSRISAALAAPPRWDRLAMSVTGNKGSAGSNAMYSLLIHTVKINKAAHEVPAGFSSNYFKDRGAGNPQTPELIQRTGNNGTSHTDKINQTRGHREKGLQEGMFLISTDQLLDYALAGRA